MSGLVLYGNKESGHSYKVALALALLGIEHEYRAVDITVPRQDRDHAFRDASRYGEVPVLVTGDGTPLVQSNAILLHLVRVSGRLGGNAGPDRLAEWLFWETNRIGFSFANLRFVRRFVAETPSDVVTWLEDRAVADLDRLDQEFAGGNRFLTGEDVSIADLSCCGYLFWFEQSGLDLARWPHVEGWLGRIRNLPGWKHPYALLG